jgi:hypothetical protein
MRFTNEDDHDKLSEAYRLAANPTPRTVEFAREMGAKFAELAEKARLSGIIQQPAGAYRTIKWEERPTAPAANTLTREMAQADAEGIGSTWSSSEFMRLFREQNLSEGWTWGDALAVWYSLGHLELAVAAWQACKDESEVFRIINLCRPMLVKQWKVPSDILAKLRGVVNETEESAFASFTSCSDGIGLSRFFSRYVSRILGAPVPFSERSISEDHMLGIKYADLAYDLIFLGSLCIKFVGTCSAEKTFHEECRRRGVFKIK